MKILVPLLDQSSLEEDEELQDLWAKLLANMLDSVENFQNHIFPYILSQISIEDFNALKESQQKEEELRAKITELEDKKDGTKPHDYGREELDRKIKEMEISGFTIWEPECDNLVRLGLVKRQIPTFYIPEFKTGGNQVYDTGETSAEWHSLDIIYEDDGGFRITELGTMFLKACTLD